MKFLVLHNILNKHNYLSGIDAGNGANYSTKPPFLSIVVPIYNAQQYIEQFLTNVLQQTFTDFELILVDDKSTDETLLILKKYQQIDRRIFVITLERNSGASTARNEGLKYTSGTYVRFIDCDDLLPHNSCEMLCKAAADWNSDVIKGHMYSYDHNSGKIVENHWGGRSYKQEYKVNKSLRELPELWNMYDHHSMIIRRDLLTTHNIKYPDLKNFQDPPMMAQVLANAKTVSIIPYNVYIYIPNNNLLSVTRQHWTFSNFLELLNGNKIMLSHLLAYNYSEIIAHKCNTFAKDWFYKILSLHSWKLNSEVIKIFDLMDNLQLAYNCFLFQLDDPQYIKIFFYLLNKKQYVHAHNMLIQIEKYNPAGTW